MRLDVTVRLCQTSAHDDRSGANLNADQRAAVEHGIAETRAGRSPGPLLVIAGARSGKTRTLTARVARLILQGADPRRILLMTFTRRAARETGPHTITTQ